MHCMVQTGGFFRETFDVNVITDCFQAIEKSMFHITDMRIEHETGVLHFDIKIDATCQGRKCTFFFLIASWVSLNYCSIFLPSPIFIGCSKYTVSMQNQLSFHTRSFVSFDKYTFPFGVNLDNFRAVAHKLHIRYHTLINKHVEPVVVGHQFAVPVETVLALVSGQPSPHESVEVDHFQVNFDHVVTVFGPPLSRTDHYNRKESHSAPQLKIAAARR